MNYLPNKLSKLRKHYNLSQSYLADILGVNTLEYMNYENGSKMISYHQMKILANFYHVDLVDIFTNSDEITLHDVNKANTDEINIEYFTHKKTIFEKAQDFISQHKLVSSIIACLLLTIIILSIVLNNMSKPYTAVKENINRLSVSETTVIYIDNSGNVLGAGSNTNGELNNLSGTSPIKVQEGEGFSIVLNEDGSVNSFGLIEKYAQELSELKAITDIAVGDNHIVAVDSSGRVYCIGDNDQGQCDLDGERNIAKVYATAHGTILMDVEGNMIACGNFSGSSTIKDFTNIKGLASSENILAILTSENRLAVSSKNSDNYLEAESWEEIVDVACGDFFVAGLDKYGKVKIEIDNDEIKEEVSAWSNIIAIDAGSDYLIGFDGDNIYGVGNNRYGQFKKEVLDKQTLEKVSNISCTIDGRYVTVQFVGVSNASGYLVSIDVGIGISRRVENDDVVKFETEGMTEGKTYTISIVSIGDGDYKDSDVSKQTFVYNKPEETVTFNETDYLNKTIEEVKQYFMNLGVSEDHIINVEGSEDDICAEDIETVSKTNVDGKTFKKSELKDLIIEYACCRVINNEEE